jgi:hypothetical protein
MANNILATGAVWAAISLHQVQGITAEPEMVDGKATNRVLVSFDFLKGKYRLTVERIPGTDG